MDVSKMKNILKSEFVSNTYYKAFNHHLRLQDKKSIEQLVNTFFEEFKRLLADNALDQVIEPMKSFNIEEDIVADCNIINPHQRITDLDPVYSDSRGWCWSCWKIKRIAQLENQLNEYKINI